MGSAPLTSPTPLPPTVPNSPCLPTSLSLSPLTPTLSLHPHPLPPCISQPFHLFTPLSPAPPPSAAPGIGKEFSCVDSWKDGTRRQKSQTQSTCVGHGVSLLCPWNVPSVATSWSLPCRNYLRLQVWCPCLGVGPSFPKVQLSGLSPELLVDIPSVFSSHAQNCSPPLPGASQARRPERGWGRRCPSLPLPLSPRAWGDWQHVEEGPVIFLTEGCF